MSYARNIAMVNKLVAKYGLTVQWNHSADGAPEDANKPWLPTENLFSTVYSVKIVMLPFDRLGSESTRPLPDLLEKAAVKNPNGLLQVETVRWISGPFSFVPSIKDYVVINGDKWQVSKYKSLSPSGFVLMYDGELSR